LAIRSILHPTDFSESSATAFEFACSLARDYKADLIVVHIKQALVALDQMGVVPVPEPPETWTKLEEQLRAMRPTDFDRKFECLLRDGEPVSEILDLVSQKKFDLVVLGTHGRTGLGRLLMGSVAEQIVRRAPCPVLTVKAPSVKAD
jgi:nucleotide-binding universal stress UspA family protein